MNESEPYRQDLAKLASNFRSRAARQTWRADSLSKAERHLFVGFFFVRKLIECRKVTDACARLSCTIHRAKIARARVVSDFRRDDLEKDLETAHWSESKIDIRQLADKVVHTWWIIPVESETAGLDGYILTTDRSRNSELFWVKSVEVARIFDCFATQAVTRLEVSRDSRGNLTGWRAT